VALVKGHDAARLLTPVLQGVQAKGCQGRRIDQAVNAKQPAFVFWRVRI